jgi:hypothetical protein
MNGTKFQFCVPYSQSFPFYFYVIFMCCQCSFENERRSELREVWSGSSRGDSIEMGSEQAERVTAAMANFSLPASAIPGWASAVPEEQWKQQLLDRIQKQQQHQVDGQPEI